MNIQQFDFSIDLMKAILWQYNDAEKIQSVLQQKQDWYNINHTKFWIDWIRDVFDLRTANQFGLSVWSIILEIPIIVQAQEPDEPDPVFGFNETTDGNFENSNFMPDRFQAQELSVEQARLVLMMRYHQLTTNGSVTHTNEMLARLFGTQGGAYVIDNHNMSITYVFRFALPARLAYIFKNYDILPRPACVNIDAINIIPVIPFGFDPFNNNFDNGNFRE